MIVEKVLIWSRKRAPHLKILKFEHQFISNVAVISLQGLCIFIIVLLSVLCAGIALPRAMADSDLVKVATGNANFANKFYKILAEGSEGKNVFFSPISAHTVLAMAYQGAAKETAASFASTLQVPDQKVAANGYSSVMNTLNNVPNVTLHVANKIYVMQNFPLKAAFKKVTSGQFLSEAESIDFAQNEAAADNINKWVEDKTNSKIKDLIKKDYLDGLTRLVLLNAVYFKGNWAHKFEPKATRVEPFYTSNTDKIDCQMMHITKRFNYREDEALDAKILEMQYTNKDVSMVIILPNARDGIKNLESKLVDVDLSTITNNMDTVEVQVSLPKFKIETDMDLGEILTKMGLGIIFDENKADFSEISDSPEQLYVSKVVQKAFIEVNEEGAEAAAATGMVMMARCAFVPRSFAFEVDHPFVILLKVRHGQSNSVLFYGKIIEPTSE